MSDPTITIEQMRAERDAARQELERVKADLQALQQWWDMNPSLLQHELKAARQEADQNAALVEELRKVLTEIWQWKLPEASATWRDGSPMSYGAAYGSNGERDYIRNTAREALLSTPPAALERVQREAAAKENDYWAEEHDGLLGGHVSAQHVVRAAELREASHG